jgi:hypothetical protein
VEDEVEVVVEPIYQCKERKGKVNIRRVVMNYKGESDVHEK